MPFSGASSRVESSHPSIYIHFSYVIIHHRHMMIAGGGDGDGDGDDDNNNNNY